MLHIACEDTREIAGISDDSNEIKKDWLFVCRRGHTHVGHAYIQEVLERGGVVLCDTKHAHPDVYMSEHLAHIMQALLTLYYGEVCKDIIVIGVSGTNGKTSVASILTQLLNFHGWRVMQIGTGFVRYDHIEDKTHNTTPGCFALANYFRTPNTLAIPYIVMEVSSHAIDQNRIHFIRFDYIIYTNITQDHLDYHLTKTHYRYTKFKLRKYLKPNAAIVYNEDVPDMDELVQLTSHTCISIGTKQAHVRIEEIKLSEKGLRFVLQGYVFKSRLLSKKNVYNIVEALVVCRRLGCCYERLQAGVEALQGIPGRLEVINCGTFTIWIDYAHTADALQSVLEFANQIKQGNVICVVGCGGDREVSKRAMMGEIASKGSDIAIFTSDNPRNEHIHLILQDMMQQVTKHVNVFENRYFAIKHAIKYVQKNDIIIIAGKGCEPSITAFGEEVPFSDRTCVLERLTKEGRSWK